jgi:hypothetical protein
VAVGIAEVPSGVFIGACVLLLSCDQLHAECQLDVSKHRQCYISRYARKTCWSCTKPVCTSLGRPGIAGANDCTVGMIVLLNADMED